MRELRAVVLILHLALMSLLLSLAPGTVHAQSGNTPPTISSISDQAVSEDQVIGPLSFTVSDAETAADQLVVFAVSSNTVLVPESQIVLAGDSTNRTVTITLATEQSGIAFITIVVSDNQETAQTTFKVTVSQVDDPPTIGAIPDQEVEQGKSTGPIPFTVGDVDTDLSALTLSAAASDTALLPQESFTFAGNSAGRTVDIAPTPGLTGTATITISVSDGTSSASTSFDLIVIPANQPPVIAFISDQTTAEDTPITVAFQVTDPETPPDNLIYTAASSDLNVVPNTNLGLGGSGTNRTLTITPAANAFGGTNITVTASDGEFTVSRTFTLTVNSVNDPPVLADIPSQSTPEDTKVTVNLVISDVDTSLAQIQVSGTSTEQSVVQDSDIVAQLQDDVYTLVITPAPNQFGQTVIVVTVSDGTSLVTDSFILNVDAVNDPPSIVPIGDQTTPEDTRFGPFTFIVQDVETPAEVLTVTVASANTALISDTNMSLGGSGVARTLTLTPTLNANGTSLITLYVGDGENVTSLTFAMTVVAVNDAPSMGDIGDVSTEEDTPVTVTFVAADVETPSTQLTYSAVSSNPTLLPTPNMRFTHTSQENRLTLTPAPQLSGSTVVTVTVSDGELSVFDTFTLTVNGINDPPVVSTIGDLSTPAGEPISTTFTITDVDTPLESLTVAITTSNPALLPADNIALSHTDDAWTMAMAPVAGGYGTVQVTVSASDGESTVQREFTLTVLAGPTMSPIADQSTQEDVSITVPFTITDADTSLNRLRLTAESSNTTLTPVSSIVFGGQDGDRTVSVTPAPNLSGSATITVTVNDGVLTASTAFHLSVSAVNDPPTISAIAPQAIDQGATVSVAFSVDDVDSPIGGLTLSASSSNPDLVPVTNVVFNGDGQERTVTVMPIAGRSGVATLTISVSDGALSSRTDLVLTVNGPPFFGPIADVTVAEDSRETIGFTVGDTETPSESLILTAQSSDETLLRSETLVIDGSGANRTLAIQPQPDQFGVTTVTLTADDGHLRTNTSFLVTVNPVNDGPTISTIGAQTVDEDSVSGPIPFTVHDIDSDENALTLFGSSSNPTLVPHTNITFGGSGANREISVQPAPDLTGTARITVTVSDGSLLASTTYTLTVTPVNDAPRIQPIDPQTTDEETPLTVTFTVQDVDSPVNQVTLSGRSGNQQIVPDSGLVFGGSGMQRTVTITPLPNQTGSVEITLIASDGSLTGERTFTLDVVNVDDGPSIEPIPDQTVAEDETLVVPITLTDIDTPLDALAVSATSSNIGVVPDGSIVVEGDSGERALRIRPVPNRYGQVTVTVTVNDGQISFSRSFDVTVTPVNDPPLAVDDFLRIITTPVINIGVLANDRDVDRDALRVVAVSGATHGAVSINSDDTLRYQMPPDFTGTDTFTYTIRDGNGGVARAQVHLTVVEPPGPNTPAIDSVDPDHGENHRSVSIVLTGINFAPGARVTVGPYPLADVEVMDDRTLRASVPAFLPPDRYDVVVSNPDGWTAVRAGGFTVETRGLAVVDVRPNRGRVDLPTWINIYGLNFSTATVAYLDRTPLRTRFLNARHLQAELPAQVVAPGLYPLTVRNPDGVQATLADAYTAFVETDDDLFAYPYELWTEPTTLHVGQSIRLGLRVHRQVGERLLLDVPVAFYSNEPSAESFIGRDVVPLLQAGDDAASTNGIPWTPPAPGVYTLYAILDPDGTIGETNEENNRIARTITVLPTAVDMEPPHVTDFVVNEGLETTVQPTITLSLRADDSLGAVRSVFFVEYEYVRAAARWTPVQWSGWLDYTGTPSVYTWRLLPAPGVRYLYAWVADDRGNITPYPATAFVNYLPPDDNVLPAEGVRIFRYTVRAGDQLSAFVLPSRGDPDLYVWAPDHESRPPWITNLSSGVDEIGIVAPLDGVYQVEIVAHTDTTYRSVIEVRPIGPRLAAHEESIDPSKARRSQPYVPVSRVPPLHYALPSGLPAPPQETPQEPQTSTPEQKLYLPFLYNDTLSPGPSVRQETPPAPPASTAGRRLYLPQVRQ